MKILQVIPSLELAGAETMCENLCYALSDLGHDVTVVSMYSKDTAISRRLENRNINVLFLDKHKGFDMSCIFKIAAIIKREDVDVVHSHLYASAYTFIACKIAGVKRIVHTVHNIASKESSNIIRKVNAYFYRHSLVTPVALDEITKESIVDYYKLEYNDVPIINNGININKCIEKESYEIKDTFVIINIARFSEQKNHDRLIEAFNIFVKENPNAILQLIGIGPRIEHIEEKVNELELNECVKFLYAKENVYNYLNEADVFVLSSDFEGMPMSLIEAMGTGLPIITTAVGGIPSMLDNGVNAILTKRDANEIACAFAKIKSSIELRQKLGNAAKNKAKLFSSETMAKEYEKVYIDE